MSIEALDELLTGDTKPPKTHVPASKEFVSVRAWAWMAFNTYFDQNQLGKKKRKLAWKEQTMAHLDGQKESL